MMAWLWCLLIRYKEVVDSLDLISKVFTGIPWLLYLIGEISPNPQSAPAEFNGLIL